MSVRTEWSRVGDAELVAAIRGGGPASEAAAAELFGRYHGRVYAWCRRYRRDPDQALDLVSRYAEAGAARVNIAIRPPADWDALHAWAETVIPAFAKKEAPAPNA